MKIKRLKDFAVGVALASSVVCADSTAALTEDFSISYNHPQIEQTVEEEICMKGQIFSDQHCKICGSIFKDNHKSGLCCPNHPDQQPTRYIVRFGRQARKRFTSYEKASRYLNGLRWETDTGKFDAREHQASNPLGLKNLYEEWLDEKENEIDAQQLARYRRWMDEAASMWGKDRSVKTIQYRDFTKYLNSLKHHKTGEPLSDTSKAKVRSCLHAFFTWLRKTRVLDLSEVPEIPYIAFDNEPRAITDGDTQALILEEMEILERNRYIPIAARLLMTYFSIRPGQLSKVRHKDIDHNRSGIYVIRKGKKGQKSTEFVPMLPEHMELLKSLPSGMPDLHVFRLFNGNPFNTNTLPKAWKRAVRSLKKKDLLPQDFSVDFYGGSRHTSISMLEGVRPEEIRQVSKHMNISSFQHYIRWQDDKSRKIFQQTMIGQGGPQVDHPKTKRKTEKT